MDHAITDSHVVVTICHDMNQTPRSPAKSLDLPQVARVLVS